MKPTVSGPGAGAAASGGDVAPSERRGHAPASRRQALSRGGPEPDAADRELARAFVERRSEKAFRELYRRHAPRLYRLVSRLRGVERRDAEDVLQETWLRAARALPAFRFESRLHSWLTGIALNVCRELDRAARASPAAAAPSLAVAEPAAPPRAGRIDRMDLELAIASLPAGYREVLLLHDLEGYTHREIGALLSIDEGTSKSQLARARAALRRHWRTNGTIATTTGRETEP